MRTDTALVRFDPCPDDPHHPTATPIYQTATFAQESAEALGRYDYARSGNPTRAVLESQLTHLEGGCGALAYASGMAALAACCRLVGAGGHVVAGEDLYGGTYRLLADVLAPGGIRFDLVDTTDASAVARAMTPATRIVLIETPTNPLLRIVDIAALARVAHERGALLAVDGTMMSPYWQRPLSLGADLVVHSATKLLGGHGDLTAGAVVTRDPEVAGRLAFAHNAEGVALGPFDSWLLLRGMKTMAVRLDRQQENARRIAGVLAGRADVRGVRYPGLATHSGHALHRAQSTGDGCVLSFETGSLARSVRVVEALELFTISVSLGSVASQVSIPSRFSHKSIPAELRSRLGLPDDLVRLSIGIEDVRDLEEDLARALGA